MCCAGREYLSTALLTEEFVRIQLAFKVRLELSGNLTIALDGWPSLQGQSLYAVNVIFPDRTVHVLAMEDLPLEKHTTAYLTGARRRRCNPHLCTQASQRGVNLVITWPGHRALQGVDRPGRRRQGGCARDRQCGGDEGCTRGAHEHGGLQAHPRPAVRTPALETRLDCSCPSSFGNRARPSSHIFANPRPLLTLTHTQPRLCPNVEVHDAGA